MIIGGKLIWKDCARVKLKKGVAKFQYHDYPPSPIYRNDPCFTGIFFNREFLRFPKGKPSNSIHNYVNGVNEPWFTGISGEICSN